MSLSNLTSPNNTKIYTSSTSVLGYTPAVSANWATPPTQVSQALDELAGNVGSSALYDVSACALMSSVASGSFVTAVYNGTPLPNYKQLLSPTKNTFVPSTGLFTCVTPAWYEINASALWVANASTAYRQIEIVYTPSGGSPAPVASVTNTNISGSFATNSATSIGLYLQAGDTISVSLRQDSGSPLGASLVLTIIFQHS